MSAEMTHNFKTRDQLKNERRMCSMSEFFVSSDKRLPSFAK